MSEHVEPVPWPRLLAAVGALALGAAAMAIVAVLGHRTPGPVESSATAARAQPTGSGSSASAFPAPPEGAVVFSRADDSDVLALGVVPRRNLLLQASVVSNQGEGVGGLRVSFRAGARIYPADPCGAGCYRATLSPGKAPQSVQVDVARETGTTHWQVALPRQWPPRSATTLIGEATRTFRKLRSLSIHDRLASDDRHAVVTRWRIVAPDKLDYQVENGPQAVIIGGRRWDRSPGGEWEAANQQPVHQPTPFWKTWQNAHVLASTGRAWRVSFFDPETPGWYELVIEKGTMRTLEMQMHAQAHFMRDVYGSFNKPFRISPPTP